MALPTHQHRRLSFGRLSFGRPSGGLSFGPAALVVVSALGASGCLGPEVCSDSRSQAIIDGELASGEESSATGALLVYAEAPEETLAELACSAVLIAPDVALTAAHCIALYQGEEEPDLPPVGWFVSFAGDVSAFEDAGGPVPKDAIAVRSVDLHPEFSLDRKAPVGALGKMDDIAVLLLTEAPVGITPVPILSGDLELTPDSSVTIEGYGLVDPEDLDFGLGIKRTGTSHLFEVGTHELRVGRALVAGEPTTGGLADKCYGDSGGPTFLATTAGRTLIGITSRGDGPRAECGVAGVDTRVDAYTDFIEGVAREACRDGRRAPRDCELWPPAARSAACLP